MNIFCTIVQDRTGFKNKRGTSPRNYIRGEIVQRYVLFVLLDAQFGNRVAETNFVPTRAKLSLRGGWIIRATRDRDKRARVNQRGTRVRRVSCQGNSFKTRMPRLIACDTVKRGSVSHLSPRNSLPEYFYPRRGSFATSQSSAKFRRAFRVRAYVRIIGEKKKREKREKEGNPSSR